MTSGERSARDCGGVIDRQAEHAEDAFGVVYVRVLGGLSVQHGPHDREHRAAGGEQRDALVGDGEATFCDAFAEIASGERTERREEHVFPQSDRLDDKLGRGWAGLACDRASETVLTAAGLCVVDPGVDREWLRERGMTWAVLRPDRYVFACGGPDDLGPGIEAWRRVAAANRPQVLA